tara:strand:+ start:227 stop:967 length:741 start_codon:yes stop_codon:yes gene_type:complete
MLKTVEISTAKKLKGCAVTYRSGNENMYGTCPADCELNPSGKGCGAGQIDHDYLDAVLDSKPRAGYSFTYTHFSPMHWAHKLSPIKTVLNYSTANPETAAFLKNAMRKAPPDQWQFPMVTVVPQSFWQESQKNRTIDGVQFVRCPEETGAIRGCGDCGGRDGPLCARLNRDYVITFTAHGTDKNRAGDSQTQGGCYAGTGNVAIHWRRMPGQTQAKPDGETLREFARNLPPRSILRHHIAGDIGKE